MLAGRDTTPKGVRRSAGAATIALTIAAAWFGYCAVSAEVTGEVMDWGHRSGVVNRDRFPEKFRQHANFTWGAVGFCLVTAVGSFMFYRKLGECV